MSAPIWNVHHTFCAKNDFLLFYSSVNSGLHNYGHKTITLMIIICSKDVEGFTYTEYCASESNMRH